LSELSSWIRSLYTQIGKGLSYSINGKRSEGLEVLKTTEAKMKERGVTDPEAMYKIAQAYALLGDKPAALRMLSQALREVLLLSIHKG
jgi:hypothetical protein